MWAAVQCTTVQRGESSPKLVWRAGGETLVKVCGAIEARHTSLQVGRQAKACVPRPDTFAEVHDRGRVGSGSPTGTLVPSTVIAPDAALATGDATCAGARAGP